MEEHDAGAAVANFGRVDGRGCLGGHGAQPRDHGGCGDHRAQRSSPCPQRSARTGPGSGLSKERCAACPAQCKRPLALGPQPCNRPWPCEDAILWPRNCARPHHGRNHVLLPRALWRAPRGSVSGRPLDRTDRRAERGAAHRVATCPATLNSRAEPASPPAVRTRHAPRGHGTQRVQRPAPGARPTSRGKARGKVPGRCGGQGLGHDQQLQRSPQHRLVER